MADRPPLARSSIPVGADHAVIDGWSVATRVAHGRLRLRDETRHAKVLVRARDAGAVAAVLGVASGAAARDAEGTLVVGSGPGEWLLVGRPGTAGGLCAAAAARLAGAAPGDLVTVVDLTSARVLLRLTGPSAAAVLAMLCAVDVAAMPEAAALRTSVAGVVTEVVRDDVGPDRSHLLCFDASYGRYLVEAVLDAGAEHGIEVEGASPA